MTLNSFAPGVNTSFSTQLNANYIEAYTIGALNLIRQLQAATITYSKGLIDWWGEAYINSVGRMSSVTSATTAWFETNKYISEGAAIDTDTVTNGAAHASYASSITLTFTALVRGYLHYIEVGAGSSGTCVVTIKDASLNTLHTSTINQRSQNELVHSSWSRMIEPNEVITVALTSGNSIDITANKTYSGTNISLTNSPCWYNGDNTYILKYDEVQPTTSIVVAHTIPVGTFSSTISKAIAVPMVADWETGADIQYKLTNGSEDSGYLACGITPTVSSFTAFTSEPTTLTVKLIPKSSSPTVGYPAIYGFAVRAA